MFGPQKIRAFLPDGWGLRAVYLGEREITDEPIEVPAGEEVSGLQVVITRRVTKLAGQIHNRRGEPVQDGTVVAFTEESARWGEDSRFVQFARPDQQGRYRVTGLPAGRYLAVAVDYIEEGSWHDAEVLESLRSLATEVTLDEEQSRELNLPLKPVAPRP